MICAVSEWDEHLRREVERYRDGERRLPEAEDADARQRQLTRIGNAAAGAALASLMQAEAAAARDWFHRARERYRESWDGAPPESWGRLIAILKAQILAGDWDGAEADARWVLEQGPDAAESPIARYAAVLALLVLGEDGRARVLAGGLRTQEGFPADVGDALATLAAHDAVGYIEAVESVLKSFEAREAYLEDVPVADTVLVLQALAGRRSLAAQLDSSLLPASPGSAGE